MAVSQCIQGFLLEVNPLFKVDQWWFIPVFDVFFLKDGINIMEMYL